MTLNQLNTADKRNQGNVSTGALVWASASSCHCFNCLSRDCHFWETQTGLLTHLLYLKKKSTCRSSEDPSPQWAHKISLVLPLHWQRSLWPCSELSAAWEGSKHPQMLHIFSVCFKSDRGSLCHMEWLWQWLATVWWHSRCTSAGRIRGCPSWVQDTWTYSAVELNHCECCCHAWINWVTDETGTSWAGCRSRGPGWG